MAVEILILSGTKRNERITLDGRQFHVDVDPNGEVFFDSQCDRAAKDRSAHFRLQEDGWYIRGDGGKISINGQRVVGATHVRSGDVIRISESGPTFSFHIVASARVLPANTLAGATISPLCLGEGSEVRASQVASRDDGGAIPCEVIEPSPRAVSPLPLGEEPAVMTSQVPTQTFSSLPWGDVPGARAKDQQWAVWIMGVLALGILALATVVIGVVALVAIRPQGGTVPPGIPPTPQGQPIPEMKPPQISQQEPGENHGEKKPEKPPINLRSQLEEAVFLIQVEKSDRFWPFATCVSVSGDTLLTTAREAAQLAKWRNEGGFKVWVTRQAGNFKEEVQDIRVLAPFASLPAESGDLFYVDIGLLTVRGPLPKAAPLASSKELDEIKEGFPAACFGFTHDGTNVTSYDKFEPCLTRGKVRFITAAPNLPGQPKLLHVQAEIPKNGFGSPVVSAAGKVIGLYGEAIPENKGLKNLHYVTLVNPEQVNLWMRDHNAEAWPPASPGPTAPETRDKP